MDVLEMCAELIKPISFICALRTFSECKVESWSGAKRRRCFQLQYSHRSPPIAPLPSAPPQPSSLLPSLVAPLAPLLRPVPDVSGLAELLADLLEAREGDRLDGVERPLAADFLREDAQDTLLGDVAGEGAGGEALDEDLEDLLKERLVL